MPVTFPSINPTPATDGVPYVSNGAVPAAEGDLLNPAVPVPVMYTCALLAVVQLTAQGNITSQTTYIVAQTDLGDSNWVDIAWCTWSGTSGSATFALSGGVAGADSFQQRASGIAPSGNGFNQNALGGRIRFVGKASINPASGQSPSPSPAAGTQILATVRYKLLGLR